MLFDFEGRFAACNDEGKKFVPEEKRNRHYYISDFLRDQGLDDRVPDTLEDITFAQRFKVDGQWLPYRFDLHNLCDKEGHHLGYLVVLVDHSFQVDLLTSFHTKAVFEQTFKRRDPRTVRYPVTISVCDLNHLADLNIEQGRAAGDDAIKCMADAMQNAFPSDSFFVRHDEANLLVLNEGMEAEEAKKALLLVEEELRHVAFGGVNLEMQSAVSVAQEGDSLIKAADEALLALRMRKMLDFESAHSSLLASLAMTQRQSDGETEEHIRRTRAVADVLSRRLGLSDWDQSSLALLCLLHDIGKVGVPLEILNKPGRLTDAEWVVLKSHTTKGYEIASASSELRGLADGILHHHERWDGAGYPDGLSGETIPLLARILAVIDTYDAMTHDRPYRRRVSKEVALDELRKCAGTQFDPVIVAEFLEMIEQGVESDQALLDDAAYSVTDALLEEDPMPQHVAAAVIEARSMGVDEGESAGETEVLGLVPYAKYQLNSEGSIIYVSDNFQELTGYSWQDVQDYSLTQQDLLFPEDTAAYWKIVNEQLSTVGEAYLDHRLRRKDGSEQYVFCFGRVFFDSVLRASISEIVIGDVSAAASVKTAIERSRLSALHGLRRWQEKANQDALTGLLNRSAAREMAQLRLLGGPDETILVMVDVDHFKEFNDSYGHPEGDVLLTALARSLERAVEEDGLPCRMGGDEFAVILSAPKGASKDKIEKRVAHLWQRVSNDLKATFPTVTVSMGAAATGGTPMTVHKLYVEADQALYEAKQAGRNCFRCQW